jgi:carbamoyl-phosphate synthase small subunit
MNGINSPQVGHKKALLILEDGSEFQGVSFGYNLSVSGEVVFNTAMAGYPESLTDPSYKGQILALTYPLIGNYGVPSPEIESGLLRYFESDAIQVTGLLTSEYSLENSHWNSWKTLSQWLIENKVPALAGIDTRALTKRLREKGTMLGKIVMNEKDIPYEDPNLSNLVDLVSTKEVIRYGRGKHKIVLVDCGVKYNIIRHLLKRDTTIIRVPWDYNYLNDDYDGIFISNGPGDPKQCTETIKNLKTALDHEKPVFGICLGNQLMALAAGADTYKLKYGHRSHNQPVILKGTNKCYITSQNHGFATDASKLGPEWYELFLNVNDGTNEGIKHQSKPFFATQFHPEASSGPTDTDFLFDDFIQLIENYKK